MAEEANPVIVEEDEKTQADDLQPMARTVGEQVEAGEMALADEGKVTTDESGRPRISITPVTLEPKPEASVPTQVRGQLAIPPVTFKSLQPEVSADVAPAPEEKLTYKGVLEKLDAGETVTLQTPDGKVTYSGRALARAARTPAVSKRIQLQLAQDSFYKQREKEGQVPADPKIAFVTPTGEVDVSYLDPDLQDTAATYAEGRKALDNTLRPLINTGRSDIDVAVRQYFVDDFSTGEFFDNLVTRLAETGRAVPTLPKYGMDMVGSLGEAVGRSMRLGTGISDEWAALAPKREQKTKDYLRTLSTVLPAPTAAMGMNAQIRKRIQDDPNLTDEQKDDFLYDTTVTGERFLREFVDDETAYAVIEESFSQMNAVEQFGVMLSENMLGGGILSRTKNTNALREVQRLADMRRTLGLADDTPLEAVARIAKQRDVKFKIDNELLELGLYNKAIANQMDEAGERIATLTTDLQNAAIEHGKSSLQYRRIESEIANLQRLRNRNFFRQKISPYLTEVIGDEAALAVAGTVGRQYLDGFMGMDGETAELVGVLGGIGSQVTGLTKLGKKTVTKTVGIGTGLASRFTPDGILSPTSALFRKLTQADMTIDDYEELYFEPRYNRKMNRNERKMLKAAFQQVERMGEDTRERFLEMLQGQMDLQDELLSMFPEGEARETAAKFLEQSFAESSTLPNAIAAYQMATEKAALKGIKKGGMGAMLEAAAEMDRRVSRAQVLIEGFEKHAAEFGNPNQTQAVTELIQQTKFSLASIKEMADMEFIKLNERLDAMVDNALEDIAEPMDETFFEDYLAAKELIASRVSPETASKVAGAVTEMEEIRKAAIKTDKSLLERFRTIRAIRDRRILHSQSLATAVEALMFKKYGKLSAEMDAAYNNFRSFVAAGPRPNIDISSAVEEMLSLADASDMATFFGPQSTFFSGYLGRKARKMFERMVERTLNELPEEELQEMFTSLVEEGVNPGDLEMLMRNDPVQFGLLLHQGGKLNVFARANIEEAEDFRRAFRDYGYKTSNKAVSREFKQFEKIIDGAIESSDPEGHKELVKARGIYRQLNDPLRPGTPMNRLLGSKVGDKQTADSGPYSGMYKGKTPVEIIGEMGETIDTIMQGGRGKFKAAQKLREQLAAMTQLFGTVAEDGRMRIDLRTEEGQLAAELMEEVIEAVVYDGWAADFLAKQPAVGQRIGDPRGIGFKQTVIEELEEINDIFNMDVVDDSGKMDRALVFNITNMVSREKDIAKLVVDGGKLHDQGKKVVAKLKRVLNSTKAETKLKIENDKKAMDSLQTLTNLKDPMSFYEEFIGADAYGDIDLLRSQFMETMGRDPALAGVDLGTLFDNAIYNMAYRGIIQKGGYGPKAKAATDELKGLLGENITVHGFVNTLGALGELENPQVVRNLEKVMPPKQVKDLKNILTYLAKQEYADTAMSLALNVKGMSANEALSRAYNIARQMVSPTYVASEVTIRLMQKKGADALLLAMQSPDAAAIMSKMMRFPKLVTPKELSTFDTLVQEFMLTEVARKGQEAALTDYFNMYLGEEEQTNEENE
jgi:hypothetical protein